jgi:hypothetical protein
MTKLSRLAGLTAAIVLVSTAVQAATPVKVKDTTAYEWGSAAGGGWLAWSQGPHRRGDHDLYVKQAGHPTDVLEPGAFQEVGDIETGGTHGDILVYSIEPATGDDDIRFYDLDTGTVSAPPAGVNSAKDDDYPSISGNFLLFGRGPAGASFSKKIYLYDFTTTNLRILASAPTGGTVTPNSVRGDFVSYVVCPANGKCNVFRFTISTGAKVKMPNPQRATYWSSVADDGTTYFVQGSPTYCGVNTRIMRRAPGGAITRLFQFPNGIEIGDLDAVETPTGPVVYFTRIQCLNNYTAGIWKIKG